MSTGNVVHLHHVDNIPTRDERDWVTSHELLADVGITYRQLDYWTRTGLILTLNDPQPGSGILRVYSEDQVGRAHAVRDLLAAGVCLASVRQIVDQFTTHGHVQIGDITIARTPHGETA